MTFHYCFQGYSLKERLVKVGVAGEQKFLLSPPVIFLLKIAPTQWFERCWGKRVLSLGICQVGTSQKQLEGGDFTAEKQPKGKGLKKCGVCIRTHTGNLSLQIIPM